MTRRSKLESNQKKFKGILSKPILIDLPPRSVGAGTNAILSDENTPDINAKAMTAWKEKSDAKYNKELAERIDALFLHYGISSTQSSWQQLALALASDFVPGFSVSAPLSPGRREKWGLFVTYCLWLDISSEIKNDPLGPTKAVIRACEKLVDKYSCIDGFKVSPRTLQNKYLSINPAYLAIYNYLQSLKYKPSITQAIQEDRSGKFLSRK